MNQDDHSPPSPDGGREEPSPPTIPDFEMLRRIGRGSYGEVWLARDRMRDYRAVKVVHRRSFSEDRPYDREYDGIRRFGPISHQHASQLSVFHVGRRDGFFYYAMELADDASEGAGAAIVAAQPVVARGGRGSGSPSPRGRSIRPETYRPKTLRSVMRPRGAGVNGGTAGLRALPPDQCIDIGIALASALDHLHSEGLVHRDIKPSNIVFVYGRPKLADIGLVAGADEERSVVGTEGYMAPQGPGGVQADIYALGRVLYEMVTGFETKRFPELPDDWGTRPDRKDLQALNQVVQWACEARPERRYKTAATMLADLELLRAHSSLRYRKLQRAARVLRLVFVFIALLALSSLFVVQTFRKRAAETRRSGNIMRVLSWRGPQIENVGDGWFTNAWHQLEDAAAVRNGSDVSELASALLTGLDARLVAVRSNATAVSAAFSARGDCVVGSEGTNRVALTFGPTGETAKLGALGEGPVGWTLEGAPIQLVACSNRLILYELRTTRVVWETALDLKEPPVVLAMTPEGGRVAAALSDRVLVFETAAGQSPSEIRTQAVVLAYSPDGSMLAAGDAEGTARVWDVSGLKEIAVLRSPSSRSRIACLAFGRDPLVRRDAGSSTRGWVLAVGQRGGAIAVWDLNRLMPRSFCRGSTWTVWALAFGPDGLMLASAGLGHARLWDVATGRAQMVMDLNGFGQRLTLALDHRGRRLVCGGHRDRDTNAAPPNIGLWDIEPHRGIDALRGLSCAARKVWVSKDSQRLAALSDDWRLAVWDLAQRRVLFVFETPQGVLADNAGGCFDANGGRFAFATGHEACLFDLATGTVLRRWDLADGLSDQLEFDDRGRLLLLRRERPSGVPGEELRAWRLYELKESGVFALLHKQTDTNWFAQEMLFRPGGKHFLVWNGGHKGTSRAVRAFDVESGRQVWKGEGGIYEGDLRMCVDPRGQWFGYTIGRPYRLGIVDFERFQPMGAHDGGCEALQPSGEEFAVWTDPGHFALRDSKTGRVVSLQTDWTELSWVSAFSPDGRLFACGTEEGVVLVADIAEVKRRLAELGHGQHGT